MKYARTIHLKGYRQRCALPNWIDIDSHLKIKKTFRFLLRAKSELSEHFRFSFEKLLANGECHILCCQDSILLNLRQMNALWLSARRKISPMKKLLKRSHFWDFFWTKKNCQIETRLVSKVWVKLHHFREKKHSKGKTQHKN